jgi:hypothetical protein
MLGISRRSLQRWEREIVDELLSESPLFVKMYHLKRDYRLGDKLKPLDGYRKFILTTILFLKRGWLSGKPESNQGARKYLLSNQAILGRSSFNNWRENEFHKSPSI